MVWVRLAAPTLLDGLFSFHSNLLYSRRGLSLCRHPNKAHHQTVIPELLKSPQQFHVAMRSWVEKLIDSLAPSLPPVVPFRVPYPSSNRGDPEVCAKAPITGEEKLRFDEDMDTGMLVIWPCNLHAGYFFSVLKNSCCDGVNGRLLKTQKETSTNFFFHNHLEVCSKNLIRVSFYVFRSLH